MDCATDNVLHLKCLETSVFKILDLTIICYHDVTAVLSIIWKGHYEMCDKVIDLCMSDIGNEQKMY